MIDRIENTRRLAEQCERRAGRLLAKGEYQNALDMRNQANALRWEVKSLEADAALAAFVARVEGDGPPAIDPHGYPCCDCGRVYHGDTCPGCGHGEDVALANEYQERG